MSSTSPSKRQYHLSPFGLASDHPWLNKPDTKYNQDGVFKTGLDLEGPEAEKLADDIQVESDRYYATVTEGMTPKERKAWSPYYPFERLTDDNDNPTGVIRFHFKQNATLKLKDGSEKKISLRLQDGKGEDSERPIFAGSKIRLLYAYRDIKMTSGKQAGVRLDFCGVQVLKYKTSSGGGGKGFGAVEGYEDDGWTGASEKGMPAAAEDAAADSDY